MSLRYSNQTFINANTEIVTSVTVMTIAIPPIDISHYDKFCLMFQNRHTSVQFTNLHVQAAMDTSATAGDAPPNWVQINTGTLPQPSALGPTATVLTSAVDNCYKYIRVLASMSATAGLGTLRIQIGGFLRS